MLLFCLIEHVSSKLCGCRPPRLPKRIYCFFNKVHKLYVHQEPIALIQISLNYLDKMQFNYINIGRNILRPSRAIKLLLVTCALRTAAQSDCACANIDGALFRLTTSRRSYERLSHQWQAASARGFLYTEIFDGQCANFDEFQSNA